MKLFILSVSEMELKDLLKDFKAASDEDGLLDKKHFFSIAANKLAKRFDSTSLPAFHRIYEAFDLDGNGKIDFVELATGMSTLLYGDEKEMLKLVFGLFDFNGDGNIQMEEMIEFYKKFFVGQAKMNGYKVTASRWKTLEDHFKRIFSATDIDNNGTIEFDEFIQAVNDPDHPLGMLFLHFKQNNHFADL
jgi:Ca2+-binding EF-hand superfamily protein